MSGPPQVAPGPAGGDAPIALTVALDRGRGERWEEKYALRTLLRIAGYGCRFVWRDQVAQVDIAYSAVDDGQATLHIPDAGRDFTRAPEVDATGSQWWAELPFLRFPGEGWHPPGGGTAVRWPADVVFATFWLLTGARETRWGRDRWDNLQAGDWVPVRDGLLPEAPVSRWGRAIRDLFAARGLVPLGMPWERGGTEVAFSFTHDVDYPQIIRWIEAPRLLARRGLAGAGLALSVLRGASHFWTFREWLELEARLGARGTFYFMARRGSLLQYALGRPDDFYDIRRPEFARLFAELRDAGCEIGLHASFLAHRSAETLRVEAERVSHASGTEVVGNRHHFWHLDPDDPNETLRRHELAGLRYDSSLGLEFYPGFRRGTCHPFRPFHPGERRELDTIQVPPAWMDDHFGRRRAVNGIADPDRAAARILQAARATGGVAVVDYHSRGMNAEFYPEYGPWLARFVARELDSGVAFRTPGELAEQYREVEERLGTVSSDTARGETAVPLQAPAKLEVRPLAPGDAAETARLHAELFGDPDFNGHSVATLGTGFLEHAFYRLNIDNPDLHALVAVADGRVVGFFVHATARSGVFGHLLRRHPVGLLRATLGSLVRRPTRLPAFLTNLRYMRQEAPAFLDDVQGWCVVVGVHPDARTRRFEARHGGRVAADLFDAAEAHLQAAGCNGWYVAVRPDNAAVQGLLRRRGATEAGTGRSQGLEMCYYVKRFAPAPSVAPPGRAG